MSADKIGPNFEACFECFADNGDGYGDIVHKAGCSKAAAASTDTQQEAMDYEAVRELALRVISWHDCDCGSEQHHEERGQLAAATLDLLSELDRTRVDLKNLDADYAKLLRESRDHETELAALRYWLTGPPMRSA